MSKEVNPNISARIKNLQSLNILNTQPEEEYDDITALAAFICKTPISLITLLDEKEQFFKSRYGVELASTPIEASFCAFALENPNEPMIVTNLREDERFKELPMVKGEPNLAFYAGIPLLMDDGVAIGALCVLDTKPRQLDEEQITALKKLQKQVVKLFNLRKKEQEKQSIINELKVEKELKDSLIENIEGIFWEADANTFEFSFLSSQVTKILGYTIEEWFSTSTFWQDHIHPEDRSYAVNLCHDKTQRLEDHVFEYRIKTKSGEYIWVVDKVKVFEKDGKPHKLSGLILDINKEKELEFRLQEEVKFVRRIIDQLPIPFYLFNEEGKHLLWNKVLLNYTGYTEEEFQEIDPFVCYRGEEFNKIKKAIEQAYIEGTVEAEAKMTSKTGNEIPFYFKASKIDYYGQNCIFGVGMDMSDIKKAEKQLRLNERKYKALVEEGTDLLFLLDQEANFIDVGLNIHYNLGYKAEDLVGKNSFDYVHPEDKEKILAQFKDLFNNRIVRSTPYRFMHKDGYYIWIQSTGTNLLEDEALNAIVVNSTDITKVIESERRFKTLVQDGGDMISILDEKGHYLYVSPTTETILGITPGEFFNKNAFSFVHEEDLERIKEGFDQLFHQKRVEVGPYRFQDKEGNWRWLETVATNLISDPVIGGIVVNSRDITEKYIAQENLQRSEARYRVFFESQTNFVIRTDLEGRYTYVNKKFMEEFGWIHLSDPVGDYCMKSICEYHQEKVFKTVEQCMSNPEFVYKIEIDKPGRNGAILTTLWDFVCLLDADGNPSEIQCSGIDITERIKVEKELKRVNEMFELLNDASSESLYEYLPERRELYLAKSFERIFFHEIKTDSENLDFIHALRYPDDDQFMRDKFYSTVHDSTETSVTVKYRMLNGKGEYRWIEDTAVILRDDEGKAKRVVGTIKDITEFQKMTILLDVATKVSGLGGWELNLMNNTLSWTAMTCEIHGVPHDFQPDLETALSFYRDDFKELVLCKIDEAMNEGISFDFEAMIVTAEGNERWVRAIGDPEIIDGKSVRIYGSIQDIHERKTAEQKIRESNERFEIISRATNDAIWDYDSSQDNLFWGAGFKTLFGYDPQEVNPDIQFLISKIHPEDRKYISSRMFQYMSGKIKDENWAEEFRFLKSDGTYAYVTDQAVFIRDKEGLVIRALGAMSDITLRKEYEDSLKSLNYKLEKSVEELAQSNEELEQFAYVASHDLQEPLRMIHSFMSLLDKRYGDLLDEKGKQYIHFAIDGASRMRNIILDLLEFSRAGRDEDDQVEIKVKDLIDDVLELNKRSIREKKVKVNVGEMPTLKSFKTPLMQIFQNLIGNAIKYSKEDKATQIDISAESHPGYWEFRIKDNGIGIEEKNHQKIFQLFQRLHGKNEFSGTGIGLAIVKKNVELLGGKIELESEVGIGSEFCFTIKKI